MDNSYVRRMINLTMLSPYVVAAILDDTLPDHITLLELAADPPWVWRLNTKEKANEQGQESRLRLKLELPNLSEQLMSLPQDW